MGARLRVALIGCGRIARVHRAYLQRLPQVELVGVCDADAAARTAFAHDSQPARVCQRRRAARARPARRGARAHPAGDARAAGHRAAQAGRQRAGGEAAGARAPRKPTPSSRRRGAAGRWVTVDHNRWFDPVVQQAAAVAGERTPRPAGRRRGLPGRRGGRGRQARRGAAALERAAARRRAQQPGLASALSDAALRRPGARPARGRRGVAGRLARGGAAGRRRRAARWPTVTMSLRAQPFMNRLTLLGTEASLDVNLNNMTLIERRPRPLPKLVGKVWPNLSEAAQLVTATARNARRLRHRPAALLPRHRRPPAGALRSRRRGRRAAGERRRRPRRRRLVRRDPGAERHRRRAGRPGGVTR